MNHIVANASIFRAKRKNNFTLLNNNVLRDSRLSLKAKGLLALMLSFPDDWQFREGHLQSLSTDGRDSYRTGIKELMAAGYIQREQTRDAQGRLASTKLTVYDEPFTVDGFSVDGFSGDGKSPPTNTYYNQDLGDEETLMSASADDEGNSKAGSEEGRVGKAKVSSSPTRIADRLKFEESRINSLVGVWRENRGNLPDVRVVGPDLRRKLLAFIDTCTASNIDPLAAMLVATKAVVASGDYHKSKFGKGVSYGLGNLLAKGNWEKYYNAGMESAPQEPSDYVVGDRVRWMRNRGNRHEGTAVGTVIELVGGRVRVEPDAGQHNVLYPNFTIFPQHLTHEE